MRMGFIVFSVHGIMDERKYDHQSYKQVGAPMNFLRRFLAYERVCIQCHDNPDADAVASAFGVYRYLRAHDVDAAIIYGSSTPIDKTAMKILIKECGIPIEHVDTLPPSDILLLVDCQYGQGNVEMFEADRVAIIDHHIRKVDYNPDYFIESEYQSCSTIIWEMLTEEGYPVEEDEALVVALLYGLYTDTACFSDLFGSADNKMRTALFKEQSLFERLIKSNMSVLELIISGDALLNHYIDPKRRFAIVPALSCNQTVLGSIGDFIIQVDIVFLSFTYTKTGTDYKISLRTCHEKLAANRILEYVCNGIGSGGGHLKKAGGFISDKKLRQKYGDRNIFDVINMLLCQYMDENHISFT